jgi:hypothetical protein
MNWLDPFFMRFRDEKALPFLKETLETAQKEGLARIHVQGMDFILKDCELVWLPSQLSQAARLLGASEEASNHAWYLQDPLRKRKIDLPTIAQAMSREFKWKSDEL